MNDEMKNMASRLGLGYDPGASEHEQLSSIANQVGMPDYYYNAADNAKLYNTLKGMCGEQGIPSDVAGTPYNPETEPDYMNNPNARKGLDKGQKPGEDGSENPENGEGSGDSENGEGSGNPNEELKDNAREAAHDRDDVSDAHEAYDRASATGHPGEEGAGYGEDTHGGDPVGQVGSQGLDAPNQTHEQRDAHDHSPGDNGYGSVDEPHEGGYGEDNGYDPTFGSNAQASSQAGANTGASPHHRGLEKEKENDSDEDGSSGSGAGSSSSGSSARSPRTSASGNGGSNRGASGAGNGNQGASQGAAPAGNGYGALRNGNQGRNRSGANPGGDSSDVTNNARRNMEHNNRVNNGGVPNAGNSHNNGSEQRNRGGGKSGGTGFFSRMGARVRNGIGNNLGRKEDRSVGNGSGNGGEPGRGSSKIKDFVKKKLWLFLTSHPIVLIIVAALIFFFFIMIILFGFFGDPAKNNGNNNNSSVGQVCTYQLDGVLTTGSVDLSNVKVEIVNCDAKDGNYEVIETVDFEKYVIGVALAEVSWRKDAPDYFKAQIVAARGFALRRNSSMCPSRPDNCFYGYNPQSGVIRLRNCSNDQNYCDPEKDCYRKNRDGQKTLTGKEAEGYSDKYIWKHKLSEETYNEIMAAAKEVEGKVLLDNEGKVVYTNYVNTDQQEWYKMAKEGMSYDEILKRHYASQGASSMSSSNCSYANVNYFNYSLNSDSSEILHEPLDQFLQKKGTSLDAFNQLIASNVEKAGYGTRAGVVAAAVTLIGELGDKYGVRVPYFWGGGHGDGVVVGALAKWGSTQCHTYANGQSYNYCGLDCSGFVPWAIKNGGFNRAQGLASSFVNSAGAKKVELNASQAVLQPGDLLESSGHVVLVIGVDNQTNQYICAEAGGNSSGVHFSRRSFADNGYWGVDLTDYYNNQSNVRSK